VDVVAQSVLAERYELGRVLGRGGMGEVRVARDRRLGREVAVKLLARPALSAADRARFEAEARAAAAVTHPNVVAVYDYGVEPVPYLVMECLPGRTLADDLQFGPLAIARAVEIVRDVLAGLGAAHEKDVVHRDIKPGNVLFADDGSAKVADFGIATSGDGSGLTETGMVVGTPAYVAPERLEGEPASVRSDVYAVGVMLHEALTGERPFTGDSPIAVAYAVHHGDVRPVAQVRPEVAPALSDVVMRAMARDPQARYDSAQALADALDVALGVAHDPSPELPTEDIRPHPDPNTTVAVPAVPAPEPTSRLPVVPRRDAEAAGRRRTWHWPRVRASLLGLVALSALLVGALLATHHSSSAQRRSPVAQTPTTVAVPAPLRGPFDALDKSVRP
jgi:eukaryotic-like serine/threonine-protein kinase